MSAWPESGVLCDDSGQPIRYKAIADADGPSYPLATSAIWPDDLGAVIWKRGQGAIGVRQEPEDLQWWTDLIEGGSNARLGLIPCPHTHRSWINPDQCPGCGAAI